MSEKLDKKEADQFRTGDKVRMIGSEKILVVGETHYKSWVKGVANMRDALMDEYLYQCGWPKAYNNVDSGASSVSLGINVNYLGAHVEVHYFDNMGIAQQAKVVHGILEKVPS